MELNCYSKSAPLWLGSVVVRASNLRVRLSAGALPGSLGQLSLPSLRGIGKSCIRLLAGVRVGHVHLCRVAGNTVMEIPLSAISACNLFKLTPARNMTNRALSVDRRQSVR